MRKQHSRSMSLDQTITALADGSLRGRRRKAAESLVAERPGLLDSLERQRQVVAVLRELTPQLPPVLRTRIEEERRQVGNFPRHRFP